MMTTEAIRKTTTRNGKATRSNMCTRLCPKKATAICSTTMISRQILLFQPSRAFSANAPLTLLTANQPIPATLHPPPPPPPPARVEPRRQHVAEESEPDPRQHHLRHPE